MKDYSGYKKVSNIGILMFTAILVVILAGGFAIILYKTWGLIYGGH